MLRWFLLPCEAQDYLNNEVPKSCMDFYMPFFPGRILDKTKTLSLNRTFNLHYCSCSRLLINMLSHADHADISYDEENRVYGTSMDFDEKGSVINERKAFECIDCKENDENMRSKKEKLECTLGKGNIETGNNINGRDEKGFDKPIIKSENADKKNLSDVNSFFGNVLEVTDIIECCSIAIDKNEEMNEHLPETCPLVYEQKKENMEMSNKYRKFHDPPKHIFSATIKVSYVYIYYYSF